MKMTMMTSSPIQLQIADYSCRVDATAPPVVLLHGLLGSKKNFASLGTALAQQLEVPRQVLAVDLRNHGENTDDRPDMDYPTMALDVIHTMDAMKLDKVVLVGHSMGGKVAQTLALLHPHRVSGLVVLDMAPVRYDAQDAAWKAVKDIIHLLASLELNDCRTKRDVDLLLRQSLPDPALRAFVLTNFDSASLNWKIPIQTIASQLESLADFPVLQLPYPGDAFFIHGGQSKFVRAAYMDAIRSYFPSHLLTTIRGAGHWLHAEAPDDVLALLKKYLDR